MTRPRFYIQRDLITPELDLWAEIENAMTTLPKLHIYGNYNGKPIKLITLPAPAANRLVSVINQFNEKITNVKPEYGNGPHDNEGEK